MHLIYAECTNTHIQTHVRITVAANSSGPPINHVQLQCPGHKLLFGVAKTAATNFWSTAALAAGSAVAQCPADQHHIHQCQR